MARLLVREAVDVNLRCSQGFSPLLAAAMAGYRFCVKVDYGWRSLFVCSVFLWLFFSLT